MIFSNARPDLSPIVLWQLQNELLHLAENLLGPRDHRKIIYQPAFLSGGPYLWNSTNRDGAAAVLSMNAAGFWPAAVYEMAHETVHLLNPIDGYTNWLEEGVAVAFSLHALEHYAMDKYSPTLQAYTDALELVMELPGRPFAVPRAARSIAGALSAVTVESLHAAAPDHANEKLDRLVSICVPR